MSWVSEELAIATRMKQDVTSRVDVLDASDLVINTKEMCTVTFIEKDY